MKKMMYEAKALTESALLDLYAVLDSVAEPNEFYERVDAVISKQDNLLSLPVSLGLPDDLSVSGTRSVDVTNAPLVHEYIGELDRANASDARLWTYLAFGTFREYMEKRWPLTLNKSEPEKWKRRARDRWLMHIGSVTRGRLVRHGIARLWWVAHLTYIFGAEDGIAKNDPYAYTKEVLKSEDRVNALFDREVGALSQVRTAVLDHAASVGAVATDKYVQRIMQYLTLINGYRDVGMLDVGSVNALVDTAGYRLTLD